MTKCPTYIVVLGDGYQSGWQGQPGYGMPPGYPGAYDYSAYYGQPAAAAPAYGAYGQAPPSAYPYAQAYAAAAASSSTSVPSSGELCLCDVV